jgi:hypothetical protein
MLTNMTNSFIEGLGNLLQGAASILPTSPFQSLLQVAVDTKIIGMLSWVVPFPQIIALLQAWITAVALWYAAVKVLRWAKQIS